MEKQLTKMCDFTLTGRKLPLKTIKAIFTERIAFHFYFQFNLLIHARRKFATLYACVAFVLSVDLYDENNLSLMVHIEVHDDLAIASSHHVILSQNLY